MSNYHTWRTDIYAFFEDCPDILPPKSMRDLLLFAQALENEGEHQWAAYFTDLYYHLNDRIVQEIEVYA
jgi:hypothetical protein